MDNWKLQTKDASSEPATDTSLPNDRMDFWRKYPHMSPYTPFSSHTRSRLSKKLTDPNANSKRVLILVVIVAILVIIALTADATVHALIAIKHNQENEEDSDKKHETDDGYLNYPRVLDRITRKTPYATEFPLERDSASGDEDDIFRIARDDEIILHIPRHSLDKLGPLKSQSLLFKILQEERKNISP